jgi:hypothetical protein
VTIANLAYNAGLRLSLVAICVLARAAGAQNPAVPQKLEPPAGERLVLQVHATGDQIYVCKAGAWAFKAPEASLFDKNGTLVGKHFAGPTWESSDGSQVKGRLAASRPSPDPSAIPWLLLTAVEHNGTGVMSSITSIQRLHTQSGQAPEQGCDAAHEGVEHRSGYAADSFFYARAN